MMMKKLLAVMLCLMMIVPVAMADDLSALTGDMLDGWVDDMYLLAVMQEEMTANPVQEGDHYTISYSFGTYSVTTPGWQDNTHILGLSVTGPEVGDPMGVQVGSSLSTLLNAYANDNPTLLGTDDTAVLYLVDLLPDTAMWARAERENGRVYSVQYACQHQLGDADAYHDAGILYTIENDIVTGFTAYGLYDEVTLDTVHVTLDHVAYQQGEMAYQPEILVENGTEFNEKDLVLNGKAFDEMTPDDAAELLGSRTGENEFASGEGTYKMITFDKGEADFNYNTAGEAAGLDALILLDSSVIGPRGIHVGMSVAEVINTFRQDEHMPIDGRTVLYGDSSRAPYGELAYVGGVDGEILYIAATSTGRVAMRCCFENNTVVEILIYHI